MGYSWPSFPLSRDAGQAGWILLCPDNVKGPCGKRQAYDLGLEKACNSQALGIIHTDESKCYGSRQGQSVHALAALINKAQPLVLNRPIKQISNNNEM